MCLIFIGHLLYIAVIVVSIIAADNQATGPFNPNNTSRSLELNKLKKKKKVKCTDISRESINSHISSQKQTKSLNSHWERQN